MLRSAAVAALLALTAVQAHATAITDPVGDFIPSFAGAQTPDRDVVSASADLVNGNFIFRGSFNGAAGSTAGTVYVFGVNRGQGTARFGAIAPNVLFDSVVIVTPNVSTVVRGLLTGEGTTTLAADATSLSGNSLSVAFASSLLPGTGFTPDQYTVNLWPRSGLGNNNQIADFAPDNSNFGVTVPEPASLALLGFGVAGVLGVRRGRPSRA